MEHYGGRPLYISEIEPLEEEAYVALAIPMLDEIIKTEQKRTGEQLAAFEYLRASETDGAIERIGVVIAHHGASRSRQKHSSYDITLFHYKEYETTVMDNKDSTVYKIVDNSQGVKCSMSIGYADGIYIAEQQMNRIEHEMLLDELCAAHQWQLVAAAEHDILNT